MLDFNTYLTDYIIIFRTILQFYTAKKLPFCKNYIEIKTFVMCIEILRK